MLNRRIWIGGIVALAAVATAAGVIFATTASVSFERESLTIESTDDRFEFDVELAITPKQRQRGLMFRTELAEDSGMLFDFGRMQPVAMWMRNTFVSLDMLFIRDDGTIARIARRTKPLTDDAIASQEPVRAVLELRAGVTEDLGIEPGDRLIHPLFGSP